MKKLIPALLLILYCSTAWSTAWSADLKEVLAFAILDNKRDMGTAELLRWAIGTAIVFCLARWSFFGAKRERPVGKIEETLRSIITVLLFSVGLSFLIRLIGFVISGESVSIGEVLLYTAIILVWLLLMTYPTHDSLADDHEEKTMSLFWKRLLWLFSVILGLSLAFVYFSPLELNLVSVTVAIFTATVSSAFILILDRVFPWSKEDYRFPGDIKNLNRALFRGMIDESSKDPNFNHDRWVAKNRSRIDAAERVRRRK